MSLTDCKTESPQEAYAYCNDCGEELSEDTIFGEWDDLCESCCNERIQCGRSS